MTVFRGCSVVTLAIVFCWTSVATGQTNTGSNLPQTQGSQSSGSFGAANNNSTISLGARFQGDSLIGNTGGSQSIGQTTAGMGAAQGVAGGSTQGTGGRSSFGSSMFGMSGMGGMGRGGMGGMFGQNNNSNGQQQGNREIRTRMVIGFEIPEHLAKSTMSVNQENSVAMARMHRVLDRAVPEKSGSVQVTLDGSTAVLQGSVQNDHQKKLVEMLLKMEPGIADVKNELTVDPDGSKP